jgi:hypothetical protein
MCLVLRSECRGFSPREASWGRVEVLGWNAVVAPSRWLDKQRRRAMA